MVPGFILGNSFFGNDITNGSFFGKQIK